MIKLYSRNFLVGLFLSALAVSTMAWAQQDHSAGGHEHDSNTEHSGQMNMSGGNHGGSERNGRMMQMSGGDHGGGGMMQMHEQMVQRTTPMGQSAMAVLRDVIDQLQADPNTDWSQVNIEALRQHLIDMDRVALYAESVAKEIPGGAEFEISGDDERTLAAIKRMVPAHAAQIQGELGWETEAQVNSENVVLRVVSADQSDEAMIRGLGFSGIMVLGDHHAPHHLMMAGGQSEHEGMNHDSEDHSGHH